MAERAGAFGKYYAVEFEILGDGQYAEEIASFSQALPMGIFRLDSLTSGDGNDHDHEEPMPADQPEQSKKKPYVLKKEIKALSN
jgi:hypothetical protein